MSERRSGLSRDERASKSSSIAEIIRNLPQFESSRIVALYVPLSGEVSLDPLLATCRATNRTICLPRYDIMRAAYCLAEWHPNDPLQSGHAGVPEPKSGAVVDLECVDILVVPGLMFDPGGGRLGRGGGHYDRLLARSSHALRVGVAFDFQITDSLPVEEHDERMDLIVTEKSVYKPRGRP